MLPHADPRHLSEDGWFGADRVEHVLHKAATTPHVDADALDAARKLTESALSLECGGDGVPTERAARLHVLAAELKRLNGAGGDCLVDYLAITRHLLGRPSDAAATLAYLRKVLHVADLSTCRAGSLKARLLAAQVYVATWQGAKAGEMAREARKLASEIDDHASLERAEELMAAAEGCPEHRLKARCPCGGRRPFATCCGLADEEVPGEHLVRVYANQARLSPSPFWTRGSWGLDLLMRPPRNEDGEFRTFYSWRIQDGRYKLMSYPNWPGRALGAAAKMAELAKKKNFEQDATASAILQAICALEAFETAWKLFRNEDGGSPDMVRARHARVEPDPACLDQNGARVTASWHGLWTQTFGSTFERNEADRVEMNALFKLRNDITHSVGGAEQLVPRTEPENEHVQFLAKRSLGLGPETACWADRVLTAAVAEWAVSVASRQIAEVRKAYEDLNNRNALREGMSGFESDAVHDEEVRHLA